MSRSVTHVFAPEVARAWDELAPGPALVQPMLEPGVATAIEVSTHPSFGPLLAFGTAGPYDRAALARLYGGMRVRVARRWQQRGDQFVSETLLSPYPDATLARLNPGTMVIRWIATRR